MVTGARGSVAQPADQVQLLLLAETSVGMITKDKRRLFQSGVVSGPVAPSQQVRSMLKPDVGLLC